MTAKVSLLLLTLPLFGFSFSSCSSVVQKQSAAQGTAIYATQRAIEAGRFDLAKKYNAQAARLAVAPKKTPQIRPFLSQGKRYVVLPPEFTATPALAIGSPAADSLIFQDKALQGQLSAENKALASTEKATDQVIAEKEKIVEKAETAAVVKAHSFWGRVKFYGILAALGLGLGALCYFFPPAIPILLSIGRAIFSLISSAVGSVVSFIGNVVNKWKT